MEQKPKTYIRPIVIVMIFAFLTIGYAYLTSALNINGATLLKKPTWDVHFENVQVKDGSVTGEQVTQEPTIGDNETSVTFHVNLKLPGDYYEFTVDAVNAGTIDAMINTYTEFDLTTDQLKYLETSVTYEDGEEIQEKQQLLAGDFAVYKIVVSFKKDLEADDLPSAPEQLDLEFSVEFVQKDDTAIRRQAERILYNVLKNETISGTYAKEYTGEHKDSFTEEPSKSIYYWYGTNINEESIILNRWNVLFGGFCWQMLRTTDTGGVKLIYNGIPNNGKCDRVGADQMVGSSPYNTNYKSPAYVGYMYNTAYNQQSRTLTNTETMYSTTSLSTSYWYADSVTWGSPTESRYNLDNPYQVSSTDDYSSLVGKYTFRNSSETYTNTSVYYIAAVYGSTMYYIQLTNTGDHTLSYFNNSYTYGDSYTNNGNGTYIINNPTTIYRTEWNTGYSNVGTNKYVCKNAVNNTCSELWYITNNNWYTMTYIKTSNNIKYSKGFTWNGSKYILDNDTSISFWNISDSNNKTSINNAHYTCWNANGECTTISYIYYISGVTPYYISLSSGKSVEDAKNEMLYNDNVNQINSTIKNYIDNWYSNNMTGYTNYLEDTIFCNSRSQSNESTNGWNPNGGSVTTYMKFHNDSLKCPNEVDQFSLSNSKAQLTYPVGLIDHSEFDLLFNGSYLLADIDRAYWLISPLSFEYDNSYVYTIHGTSYFGTGDTYLSYGVRPAVSLKPGTIFVSGDGSMANPYVIDTN